MLAPELGRHGPDQTCLCPVQGLKQTQGPVGSRSVVGPIATETLIIALSLSFVLPRATLGVGGVSVAVVGEVVEGLTAIARIGVVGEENRGRGAVSDVGEPLFRGQQHGVSTDETRERRLQRDQGRHAGVLEVGHEGCSTPRSAQRPASRHHGECWTIASTCDSTQ